MAKMNLVALFHVLSGAGVVIASVYSETDLMASASTLKPLGFALVCAGMMLFLVSAAYLSWGLFGLIEPVADHLVTAGPYSFVRHPIYLGLSIGMVGLAIEFNSLWGMGLALFGFIPVGICRAKLEEEALARRFGKEWEEYNDRTFLLLPPLF
jgi:protein-S-isoprenylcysteine O-methyltransferase Ste14